MCEKFMKMINGGGDPIVATNVIVVWNNWEMKDFNVGVEDVNPTPNLVALNDDVVGAVIDIIVWALAPDDNIAGVVGIVVWVLAMVAPS